jgi:hypothetical protein
MSGLTEESVSELVDAIAKGRDRYFDRQFHESAVALNEVLLLIEKFRTENNRPQPSRPDRVGDECWFRTGGDWQKGILRAWDVGCECSLAIVEDKETGVAKSTINISFSAEAPT